MSDETAIRVEGVSKNFKLPHEKTNSLKSSFLQRIKGGKRKYEVQHALKDVSFEVKKGEFFGIVGRNGSGKSTLLKILAEIYKPTKGSVKVNGKLVPFIELGVGFNPELTGKDNVYLSASLLGFSRKEISDMYDDIVQFAELEKFMDQKLKNYSSGMQVRLAFSIATRSKADILVLDEVLAVGDEAFQRKCNDYFRSIKKERKTIILVTHSMESVRKFCDRAMLIHDGVVKIDGTPEDVSNQYTEENLNTLSADSGALKSGLELGLSKRVPYFQVSPVSKTVLNRKDTLEFKVEYEIIDDTPVCVFFSIYDEKRGGVLLANGAKAISGKGRHSLNYRLPMEYYNDTDFLVHAVLDEDRTRERIAFTNDANSCRFVTRNTDSDNGLLRKDNNIHGHWVGWEEYSYNLKALEK